MINQNNTITLYYFHEPGQEYTLTGSSKYAVLGKDFTWTCGMFVPPGEATKGVRFFRNNVLCAIVEHTNGTCSNVIQNTRYTYGCSSTFSYTLTIPAENMTEYERDSMWMCQYSFDLGVRFRSLLVTLHLAGIYHLSGLFIASLFSSYTNYVRTKTLFLHWT